MGNPIRTIRHAARVLVEPPVAVTAGDLRAAGTAGGRRGRAASTRARRAWWLWPHLLSLDAPLVALAWQDWWSRAGGPRLPWSQRVILGLGVWMIYLADRLADTLRSSPGEPSTARHHHARIWRTPLFFLTVLIGASLVVLAPWVLRPGQFCGGLGLLTVSGAYFWLIHRRGLQGWAARLPKEAVVGGIYALGTAFFAFCRPSLPPGRLVVAVVLFGIVCFFNCALITSWERNVCDQRDPFSFLNAFPHLAARGLRTLCWGLAAIALGLGLAMHATIFLPVALGAIFLGVLDRWQGRLSPNALRCLADAVLLTPWICGGVIALVR